MLGLDTFFFFIFLASSSFISFMRRSSGTGVFDVGAFNNNRQHSSYLPKSLLCGSALQKGRKGGALGHSGLRFSLVVRVNGLGRGRSKLGTFRALFLF